MIKYLGFIFLAFVLSCGEIANEEGYEVIDKEAVDDEPTTGGPCKYEDVKVTAEVIYINDSLKVAQVYLCPTEEEQKNIFEESYTNDTIVYHFQDNDSIYPSGIFTASIEIMTEGSCNPMPNSLTLSDTSYRYLAHYDLLNNWTTDLKKEYKKNVRYKGN